MTVFTGTTGDDNYTGAGAADTFNMTQGGNDTVDGAGDRDTFRFGATFATGDSIVGGAGKDKLLLDGDYSVQTFITSTMLSGVEQMILSGGHNYTFSFTDGVIAAGKTLTVKAGQLGAADELRIDGGFMTGASATTKLVVTSGAGFNYLTVGAGANILHGGDGTDTVYFADNFDSHDRIDGGGAGGGGNTIHLTGDYSGGLTITARMMHNIQFLTLDAGFSYDLTMSDGNVAAGETLTVNGNGNVGESAHVDASHETDGSYAMYDGEGDDVFTGGAQADGFFGYAGGHETVHMGAGNDTMNMDENFDPNDRLDGGSGEDEVDLIGDYSAGVVLEANTVSHIESFFCGAGFSYTVTLHDGNVVAGEHMTVNGNLLNVGDVFHVDASAETNGDLYIGGGGGDDTLIAGQFTNTLSGGFGKDDMTCGAGTDTFQYFHGDPEESTSTGYDTIHGFDASVDVFDITGNFAVPVDAAIAAGTLRSGHFDSDLAGVVDAAHLAADHAVLFTANGGNLSGHTFLIVDMNGTGGYQASADMVIELAGATNLGSFDASNFI